MSQAFHVITLHLPSDQVDFAAGFLYQEGCLGIEEQEWGDETRLKVYFDDSIEVTERVKKISDTLPATSVSHTTIALNSNHFKPHTFEPLELVPGTWIIPPNDMPTESRVESGKKLIIRPGAAFGTGRHESTQLASEGIEYVVNKKGVNFKMLDIGTGSGILAIFGKMKKISVVDAVEIDAEARINATENFELNQLKDIRLFADIAEVNEKTEKYDLIVANILAPTIIFLQKQMEARLNTNGTVILSGIVESEGTSIEEAFKDYTLIQRFKKNEWVSYVYSLK